MLPFTPRPVWPSTDDRPCIIQSNHFSDFFLETGELFSEHKLSVAFPAEASALSPFPLDLLHFQQVKTMYFCTQPNSLEMFVFSTV